MGLLENLFQNHPIRIDIAGTAESIRKIDVPVLEKCYGSFYHPRNMLLFVTGDLERDELFEFVAAESRRAAPEVGVTRRRYPEEPAAVCRKETRKRMAVAVPKLLLGFKETAVPAGGRDFVLRELVSGLALELLFGRSSDTFRDLYEAQLILDDFQASYSAGAGIGYALLGGDTPQPDGLKEELLSRIEKLRHEGLSEEDFQRKKRKFIGGFIRQFNSLEYLAGYYTYFRFHDFDLFDTIDLLSQVTREMLEERVRALLDPEKSASFVVLPK
jgi:predicted Zn-dependent peptidase